MIPPVQIRCAVAVVYLHTVDGAFSTSRDDLLTLIVSAHEQPGVYVLNPIGLPSLMRVISGSRKLFRDKCPLLESQDTLLTRRANPVRCTFNNKRQLEKLP